MEPLPVHIQPCSGDFLVFCIPLLFLALMACFDPNEQQGHDD
jgi:hypothetical protein